MPLHPFAGAAERWALLAEARAAAAALSGGGGSPPERGPVPPTPASQLQQDQRKQQQQEQQQQQQPRPWCEAVVRLRFVHHPEWLQRGARLVLRARADGRTAGIGVVCVLRSGSEALHAV